MRNSFCCSRIAGYLVGRWLAAAENEGASLYSAAGVNPRPTVGALFHRWSPTRDVEGVGLYKPSPAEKVARHRATDEESRFVRNSFC